MDTVEETIADHVVRLRYEDIPSTTVGLVKEKILDTIGVMIAGSSAPGCDLIEQQLTAWGGAPESTVLVSGARLPTAAVAQIHGSWGHADEFCDSDDQNALKASATVVPLALAFGELRGCSGRELIRAVAVGLDLARRIGLAVEPPHGAISRDEGVFSGAVAGAAVLGLSQEQVLDAMAIGYSQLAVAPMDMASPSLTKRLAPGQVNRAAAWAVTLAARGFPAGRGFLHGPQGYFQRFRGREGRLDALTDGLGRRFEIEHCPKPYPSGRICHAPIDAALALRRDERVTPDVIEQITIAMSTRAMRAIGGGPDGEQLAVKRAPAGVVDAQTSAPYNVAVALLNGAVTLDDFTESAIRDPAVLALTAKTIEVVDEREDDFPAFITPATVHIRLSSGATLSQRIAYAKGNPNNPCTEQEMTDKFWQCVGRSVPSLDAADLDAAFDLMNHLDDVPDIAAIVGLLVRG
jgi:2-methylcitrate dehydratase PrpD